MSEVRDYSTLKWIRGELDSSVDAIRRALELYAEGDGSADSIDECISRLHQIHGTLQMMQVYGAAMLAEEMELVALALKEGATSKPDDAAEALMLGLVQLPDYLEKLESGARDIPLLLLPTLNELRATRDAGLLSEASLFAPDLEQKLEQLQASGTPNERLPSVARKLRHKYHQALLDWYKGGQGGLRLIARIFGKMEEFAGTDRVKWVFQAARAVCGILAETGAETGSATKQLMGKLDREIKGIIDHGEQGPVEDASRDLLKDLLYYVAGSESADPLVQEIRQRFGLDDSLLKPSELEDQREGMHAPGQGLLDSLRSAIGTDLTTIKDSLDLFIRTRSEDLGRLQGLVEPMRKLADTLGMVGQGELRHRLKRQARKAEEIAAAGSYPDDQDLMAMASDLLFIESSLENLSVTRRATRSPEEERLLPDLPEAEFETLVDSVIHEAGIDLARNKEAIVEFLQAPANRQLLLEVPRRFRAIAGAFNILKLTEAAGLMDALAGYIGVELLEKGVQPSDDELNAFADAVTGIEYFMEAISEGRGVQPEILEASRRAVERLRGAAGEASAAEEATPVEAADEAAEPESAGAPERPGLEDIDPEILDIFIEEAKEELAVIEEYLPRWIQDREDRAALTTFRRSFHTLKGSGRLVGAMVIGELAWSIENLLNRVIDETVEASPEVIALLKESAAVLPELIQAQESGSGHGVDVESLMERAFALASPSSVSGERAQAPAASGKAEEVEPDETESEENEIEPLGPAEDISELASVMDLAEEPGEERQTADVLPFPVGEGMPEGEEAQKPESGEGPLTMDPMLLEIFQAESETHIKTLERFLEACRQEPHRCRPEKELVRALHTLHGSADMSGVDAIAEVSSALESLVGDLQGLGLPADRAAMELIERSILLIRSVLAGINQPEAPGEDWQALVSDIGCYVPISAEAPAEPEPEPEPEPEGMVALDGDPELVEIFLEEARELLEEIEDALPGLQGNIADDRTLEELQRTLHTLKGGARLSGALPVGDLSHAFESLLESIASGRVGADPALFGLVQSVVDRIAEQIDDLARGPSLRSGHELVRQLEEVIQSGGLARKDEAEPAAEITAGVQATEPEPEVQGEPEAIPEEEATEPAGAVTATAVESAPVQATRAQREQVRVSSELLDRLVNHAGEVSIYRARIEQQNASLGFNLAELEQTVERLQGQLRQLEIETEAQILFRYEKEQEEQRELDESFDPLELDRFSTIQQVSRSLLETVNDLNNIKNFLEDLQRENETLLLQQSRVTTDLQDGLMRTRMVPFSQVVPRLHRVVRQTCQQLDKEASLNIQGAEGELDRGILERMIGPLEHMLRNAVSHGIEPSGTRRDHGKEGAGQITLELEREGTDILISISDDGRGMDVGAIRAKAIERGLLDPDAEILDSDILQFVLEHGFSTADEVTQIAGRGVGMDVVVSEIKQLGGSLDISSSPGEGSSFIVRLPLTLAITDALLVELGEEIYAIPHTSIEGVVRVSRQELQACYEGSQEAYNYAGQEYLVRYLGSMLSVGQLNLSDQRKWYPLLLVRAGEHRVALQVDGLLGNRQIVVKSVGVQISSVRWISGGTILGDGRVALILDVTALVRSDVAHTVAPQAAAAAEAVAVEPGVGRTVMVVDDSITVRKVTGRLLERHGMNVITAKDGVDAVATLQEHRPDIMLLDIEMPRMDGYELARHMRNSGELSGIPIIMITSRTGDKHRNLAMELGVKRYLGKPYQEGELLDNIYSVLSEARRR